MTMGGCWTIKFQFAKERNRESKKFNECERHIVLQDGTKLPMDDILDISGEIFSMIE